jgi:hypothetical protein
MEQGYPDRLTYLEHIASTQSEVGFRYIHERVQGRAKLSLEEQRYAVRALSRTGHPEAIEVAFELLRTERDLGILKSAVNTLWRVPVATGELPPGVVETLRALESGGLHGGLLRELSGTALDELAKHFVLGPGQEEAFPEETNP